MRRLYKKHKNLICATIPLALVLAGAAAGLGAGSQGLTTILALIVLFGSLLYCFVVANLLLIIEKLDAKLEAYERAERVRIQAERERVYGTRMYDIFK